MSAAIIVVGSGLSKLRKSKIITANAQRLKTMVCHPVSWWLPDYSLAALVAAEFANVHALPRKSSAKPKRFKPRLKKNPLARYQRPYQK